MLITEIVMVNYVFGFKLCSFFVDYLIRCKMVSGGHKVPRKRQPMTVFLPCLAVIGLPEAFEEIGDKASKSRVTKNVKILSAIVNVFPNRRS